MDLPDRNAFAELEMHGIARRHYLLVPAAKARTGCVGGAYEEHLPVVGTMRQSLTFASGNGNWL